MSSLVLLLMAGLLLLALGAEGLVRGASRLAHAAGLSPLFIGLTLVAYGTSAPELVVTSIASLRDLPGVAVGNAIGSNIFNTGFVLGVATLISPIPCRTDLVRREVLLILATTLVLLLMLAWGGSLSRPEALLFLLTLVAMTAWTYRRARAQNDAASPRAGASRASGRSIGLAVALALVSLGVLVLGAHWVVESAVALAELLGVSQTLIGLTIVAAGTSLPELATSAVAALRRESDIAIGNILGSNIFNLLGILGIAGLLHPLSVPRTIITFDIPVALFFAAICIPIGITGHRVSRLEGALLIMGYVGYCIVRVGTLQPA